VKWRKVTSTSSAIWKNRSCGCEFAELVAAVASALVVGAVVALTALLLWAGPAGAAVLDAGLNCPPCVHRGQMLLTLVLAVAAGSLIGIVAGSLWCRQ
jgi:hypothetical protein